MTRGELWSGIGVLIYKLMRERKLFRELLDPDGSLASQHIHDLDDLIKSELNMITDTYMEKCQDEYKELMECDDCVDIDCFTTYIEFDENLFYTNLCRKLVPEVEKVYGSLRKIKILDDEASFVYNFLIHDIKLSREELFNLFIDAIRSSIIIHNEKFFTILWDIIRHEDFLYDMIYDTYGINIERLPIRYPINGIEMKLCLYWEIIKTLKTTQAEIKTGFRFDKLIKKIRSKKAIRSLLEDVLPEVWTTNDVVNIIVKCIIKQCRRV